MIRTGLQYAYEHRQWIASMAFSGAVGLFFSNFNRGREASTLAYLSLHGRLTDVNFKSWLEKTHDKERIEQAENQPAFYLLRTHLMTDFARKLVLPTFLVACSVLSIQNITLSEALKKLLSQSAKTSRVAIPAFDLMTIACAPAAMKVVHMIFLGINADKRHKYESFKTFTGFLADKLEAFSYLTFALYCLGTSKTLYPTVIYTIASLAFEKLFPEKALYFPMVGQYITYTEYSKEPESWFQSVVHNIFYSDTYPTQDFASGVNLFLSSLRSSSDPYDGKLLKDLYDNVTLDETIHIEKINDAAKAGKINQEYAEALKKLNIQSVAQKITKEPLGTMPEKFEALLKTLDQQPELQATAKEVLKTYYGKLFNELGEIAYRNTGSYEHRKAFYQKQKDQIEEILLSLNIAEVEELLGRCRGFPISLPTEVTVLTQKETLSDIEIATLRSGLIKQFTALLTRIDEEMKKEVMEFGCLNQGQIKDVYANLVELFDAYLITDENETHLTKLFGMNGLFNKFHSDNPDDYYVSIEYDYFLFNLNMKHYLQHHNKMTDEHEKMLVSQAQKAFIDPKKILPTQAFLKTWDKESQSTLQRIPEAFIIDAVNERIKMMPEFEYRRLTAIQIPEDFTFQTEALTFYFQTLTAQTSPPERWDMDSIAAEIKGATSFSSSKEFRKTK